MPGTLVGSHQAADALMTMLERAGITKSSVIRVTGPSAFATLIWLFRHGYEQVGYVRAAEGSPHENPDAIIAAHACNELELKRMLIVGRQVRPGGTFIFLLHTDHSEAGVDWLLETAGLRRDGHLNGAHRTLVIARRSLPFRKAA
jgi:hypothetical protein